MHTKAFGKSLTTSGFVASTLALLLTIFVATPAGASASSSHKVAMGIYKGSSHSALIKASPSQDLEYWGGPIEQAPKVYISWWGTQWNTHFSTGGYSSTTAQTYVTNFYSNVGGSSWNNTDTQYCSGVATGTTICGSSGTHIQNNTGILAGTWVDTTSVPTHPTQSQIASAASRLMSHFGYSANATYFVFTPSGHSMSGFGTQWCAWHDSTSHHQASWLMPTCLMSRVLVQPAVQTSSIAQTTAMVMVTSMASPSLAATNMLRLQQIHGHRTHWAGLTQHNPMRMAISAHGMPMVVLQQISRLVAIITQYNHCGATLRHRA